MDNQNQLRAFSAQAAKMAGSKIIVHGGGKTASTMCDQLGIEVKMHEGRRITDEETLKVVVMIYGGWVNKQVVAQLQAAGLNATGLTGADGNVIHAHKRISTDIDFGYAGDIDRVNSDYLHFLLEGELLPVLAPLTHDKNGQILNTNADTIAATVAGAMSNTYKTRLIYILDHPGVMKDIEDITSLIPKIKLPDIDKLKQEGIISDGMIPKLHNARQAMENGAYEVVITNVDSLDQIDSGAGTRIVN